MMKWFREPLFPNVLAWPACLGRLDRPLDRPVSLLSSRARQDNGGVLPGTTFPVRSRTTPEM